MTRRSEVDLLFHLNSGFTIIVSEMRTGKNEDAVKKHLITHWIPYFENALIISVMIGRMRDGSKLKTQIGVNI